MATDIERLMVRLEANATSFEKALKRAEGVADKSTRNIDKSLAQANAAAKAQMDKLAATMKNGFAAAIASVSVAEVAKLADEWTKALNMLSSAGLSDGAAKGARDQAVAIAQASRTGFGETADLYARLTRAGATFGASQGEVAIATETVAKALKLSGAAASETGSTLVQLGQALTSGKLQGDELRSLSENAPIVAQAIADAFGVTIGQLKDLGAEGKLASDKVFAAIVAAQPKVNAAFAKTNATIADGMTQLRTAALAYVGTSGQVQAGSQIIGSALAGIANNFNTVANGALALGAVIASRLIAQGLTPAIAAFGASVAASAAASAGLNAASVSATRFGAAAGVAALAGRALSGVMALAGGPLGVAILGASAAVAYFTTQTQNSTPVTNNFATALANVKSGADAAKPAIEATGQAAAEAAGKLLRAQQEAAKAAELTYINQNLAAAQREVQALITAFEKARGTASWTADHERALATLSTALKGTDSDAQNTLRELQAMGEADPSFARLFSKLQGALQRMAAARAAARATRAEIEAIGGASAAAAEKAIAAKIPMTPGMIEPDNARNDPVLRALQGKGIADRKLADAQMDETKKKIRDKRKELIDTILKEGGTVPDNIDRIVAGVVSAEESGGGGGGKGRKGRKGGGSKAAKKDEQAEALKSSQERIDALNREREALSLTAFEAARVEEQHRLLTDAQKAGKPVTQELSASIDEQAAAYARAKVALDEAKASQQAYKDLQQFVGQSISGFFSDIVSGGKNASEALMNLTKKLADAALQAALLGEGPLAGLLGSKGSGGLVGMLFKGFTGSVGGAGLTGTGGLYASGGYTGAGGRNDPAGIVHRGEYVMSADAVKRLGLGNLEALHRIGKRGFAAGGYVGALPSLAPSLARAAPQASPTINISIPGAATDAQIRALVAQGVKAGMERTTRQIGRNAHSMFRNADMRYA